MQCRMVVRAVQQVYQDWDVPQPGAGRKRKTEAGYITNLEPGPLNYGGWETYQWSSFQIVTAKPLTVGAMVNVSIELVE